MEEFGLAYQGDEEGRQNQIWSWETAMQKRSGPFRKSCG